MYKFKFYNKIIHGTEDFISFCCGTNYQNLSNHAEVATVAVFYI